MSNKNKILKLIEQKIMLPEKLWMQEYILIINGQQKNKGDKYTDLVRLINLKAEIHINSSISALKYA